MKDKLFVVPTIVVMGVLGWATGAFAAADAGIVDMATDTATAVSENVTASLLAAAPFAAAVLAITIVWRKVRGMVR